MYPHKLTKTGIYIRFIPRGEARHSGQQDTFSLRAADPARGDATTYFGATGSTRTKGALANEAHAVLPTSRRL